MLLIMVAVGFAAILLVAFTGLGSRKLEPVSRDDATLPALADDAPPLAWKREVRRIADTSGVATRELTSVSLLLPREFPGELVALPRRWVLNPRWVDSPVPLEGLLAKLLVAQAADAVAALRMFEAAGRELEACFVGSRVVFIERNRLVVAAEYSPDKEERAEWERLVHSIGAAMRRALRESSPR